MHSSSRAPPHPAQQPKISPDAVKLCAEALRLFIKEAIDRAGEEASCSGDDMVRPTLGDRGRSASRCRCRYRSAIIRHDPPRRYPLPTKPKVEPSHVEQILAQLLLDF